MKASAICIALTIVLPAVLALPQPIQSTREGSLLRSRGTGKDEDPKIFNNKNHGGKDEDPKIYSDKNKGGKDEDPKFFIDKNSKGKDEDPKFASDKNSKLISSSVWDPTISNPNDQTLCEVDTECDLISTCMLPPRCSQPDEFDCKKQCISGSDRGMTPFK